MIVEYKVVSEKQIAHLEDAVDHRLKEGWECCGGLIIDPYSERRYCQAMTRTKEAKYAWDNTRGIREQE